MKKYNQEELEAICKIVYELDSSGHLEKLTGDQIWTLGGNIYDKTSVEIKLLNDQIFNLKSQLIDVERRLKQTGGGNQNGEFSIY